MYATNLPLKPPQQLPPSLFSPRKNPFHFRLYRRRRIKQQTMRKPPALRASRLLEPFQNFLFQFPSPSSLDFLGPAIGLASGLTLYLSKLQNSSTEPSDIGEWILFTSPTPFNRFVLLRCPSISFEGGELLKDVNEKLVEQDRHFVRLSSGRICAREGGVGGLGEKLEYQRVCVSTEDGGVISLDWPANLDLQEEHGLDTTLLVVPGTPEGSMDENVRCFVLDVLTRGFFPVIMNPRGCAGSPLTTARLFTAADSDDISTAIQFINKARPWTSLMAVGWGYGANMLTKYLAEVGERTPLIAATCINNPFDLEEATRCSPYHVALDQKLTGGLIDILRSNKELFQGRAKGFDVEKALVAKSVRAFEKAISMVSYGFEELQDFYTRSSTRDLVGNVKIPVLFIQNDDGTVPLFSIPRSLIAENPFTSLLLCSYVPSRATVISRAALSWCQNLTIEWLAAVELGLLKGRHPLLKDVDVTINLSNSLAFDEGRASDKNVKVNKLLDITKTDVDQYTINPMKGTLQDDAIFGLNSRLGRDSDRNLGPEEGYQEVENGALPQTSSIDAELVKEEAVDPIDVERGQVLQTAQVVMNMLDVTMPGTLSEDRKEKVLTAVGQGETVMKALQDAVPEDVREKLTTAVSGILQAQHTNLKFNELMDIGKIPKVTSEFKSRMQGDVKGLSTAESTPKDSHSSDHIKRTDNQTDTYDNNEARADKSAGQDLDLHTSENLQKYSGSSVSLTQSSQHSDTAGSLKKSATELETNHENYEVIREKVFPSSESSEKGLETGVKHHCAEEAGGTEETMVNEYKADRDGGTPQLEARREINTQKSEAKAMDFSGDQNKIQSSNMTEESLSPVGSAPNSKSIEGEGSDQKKDNKDVHPVAGNKPATSDSMTPAFSVTQALDALTGMDDSTQVAVNSVFGVIENMISQLEEELDSGKEIKDENDVHDVSSDLASLEQHNHNGEDENDVQDESSDSTLPECQENNGCLLETTENTDKYLHMQSYTSRDPSVYEHHEDHIEPQNVASSGWMEKEPTDNLILSNGNAADGSLRNNSSKYKSNKGKLKDQLAGGKHLANYTNRLVSNIPLYMTANSYGNFLDNESFCRYLVSKIPSEKPLDLDTTTALLLDYFPEEGQWKLLEQSRNNGGSAGDSTTHEGDHRKDQVHSPAKKNDTSNYIEPLYVVLDSESQQEPIGEYSKMDSFDEHVENADEKLGEFMQFVENLIVEALKIEVTRKLSAAERKQMESSLSRDLSFLANAVSLAIVHDKGHAWYSGGKHAIDLTSEKVGTVQGEQIIRAISSAVQGTSYLRRVLPVGVIVGSCLAALRKHFNVATGNGGLNFTDKAKISSATKQELITMKEIGRKHDKSNQTSSLNNTRITQGEEAQLKSINNKSVMVGCVTAALGASALLAQQQAPGEGKGSAEGSSKSFKEKGNQQKVADKLEEANSFKDPNIVTSLAEKAMSVAGPVVPTKEDGEVDQERLVAMLADLGQRGGILKLVGKLALLWGGIRGAMSLTDRLISFLRIAERPLYQRILGFVGMVLVLWSPVVVPLLPTLVQGWTTSNPSRFAELACIVGLYAAVTILVVLWGRRIRGYEDPLQEYGLDLTALPKVQSFVKALFGGVMIVLSIQSINALLGCASFFWPPSLPSSSLDAVTCIKAYGKMAMLAARGVITATGIVIVEELLFRSWLPEEIATDLGYHQGIIMSGLAFSLLQRSPLAIPGLWLFSLALAGFRQRSEGGLSVPVGLRTGIVASSFVLQTGGFLTYKPSFPVWVTGTHPFQPFNGIVGLAFSFLLAIILYPRQPLKKRKKLKKTISE